MEATTPPRLFTRSDVAALLGVPLRQLTWWVWALDEHKRYTRFDIARRASDQPREISAPIKPIKDMQRTLVDVLAGCYQPRAQVHGFVNGKSPATNALPHRRKKWVMRIDLKNFFPNINFGRVRGMFMAYPFDYPADVATLLAQLCCHRNQLPQGAPTSPIISNFICRAMDAELAQIARDERCHYTRYADDLVFSTDRTTFPAAIGSIDAGESVAGSAVVDAISRNGFSINTAKTNLMRFAQRQRVTGFVVNEKLNIPKSYVRGLKALLHVWERYGEDAAAESAERARPRSNWPPDKPDPEFRSVVRGRVNYVGSVKGWTDPVYLGLALRLSGLDSSFSPKAPPPLPTGVVRLFTEGESDGLHISAALRHFQTQGQLIGLNLVWEALPDGATGDKELLKQCEALSRSPQPTCCICLFDRDTPQTLKTAVASGDWKNWGNGVASVALVPPPHAETGEAVCIELLHPPDVLLREDSDGRRIFRADEFDRRTSQHKNGPYSVPHPAKTLVREDVHEFPSRKSVALSKMAFANGVHDNAPPFDGLTFDGFMPTLQVIDQAARAIAPDLLRRASD